MLGHLPTVLLLCAAVGMLLLLGGLFHSLMTRRRQLQEVRSYADAVERLQVIAAGISAKLGSGQALLDELAIAAGQICGMSHVMISVLEVRELIGEKILRKVASVRWPADFGPTFVVSQLSGTREAVQQGRTIVSSTTRPHGQTLELLRKHGLASMILVPLLVEEKVIGLLSLCDARDHVTDAQERLARLWGAQAAVILAHAKLYEQTQAALRAQRQLNEQRERLSSITAAIYAQPSFQDTLQAIVRLVPSLLGVEGACILMCEQAIHEMVIMASSPPKQSLIGRRIRTDKLRMRERFEQRRVGVVEDLRKLPQANPVWQSVPEMRSYISVPLFHSDQRPLGLLIFLRYIVGPFTREQVELAEIVAARAGVAIENSKLHQQARVDARTNAMLLRELNHRVKNNLAGIAGLLEAADAEVSYSSRPVLSRLARRVRAMADAHQLFVGGVAAITVAQLVEQVLASMGVVFGKGPRIELDLVAAAGVQLRTDRAVSLAMVLHELCYNAVAHGCGPAGRLSITCRVNAEDAPTLALEVSDDGAAAAAALESPSRGYDGGGAAVAVAEDPPRTGIGLQLVRGLVGRELHGRFTMQPILSGGTRAVVEFPLAGDEHREQTS